VDAHVTRNSPNRTPSSIEREREREREREMIGRVTFIERDGKEREREWPDLPDSQAG
jgi:hypothetical protein